MLVEIQFEDVTEQYLYLPNGCFGYGMCNSPLDIENVEDEADG